MLVLTRPAASDAAPVHLDDDQRAVVEHRGPVLRVLAAPGTGRSTTAVEVVAGRVRDDGLDADQCLLLAPTRRAAARLRDALTTRLRGTTTTPLARSHQSFGFGLLREAAALAGDPAPRLLSGPEQDVVLAELLAGHAEGVTARPTWPDDLEQALPTRTFRGELRDLLMRAVELGLEPHDLARLGDQHDRPEWGAAASVLREYDEVTALSAPGAYDPAWILGAAADLLEDDPEALDRLRSRLRLVVVDDAQELTPAGLRLLEVVVGHGAVDLVLLGDPDAATQTFRGADPRLFVSGWPDAPTLRLRRGHRCVGAVQEAADRVVAHIGVVGDAAHRRVSPAEGSGHVEVHLVRTAAQEAALLAATLRRAHLHEGRAWSSMAVVVRGGARTATLRRVFLHSGVPVSAAGAELPVRDEPAVRPFLTVLRCALDVVDGVSTLDPETVGDLLASPVGGADAVTLRRLRRSLRRQELAAGGSRPGDVLLAEAVLLPAVLDRVGPEARAAHRVGRVLSAALRSLRAGEDVESVLWSMWEASGLAEPWRDAALAGGTSGRRADRDLDAVLGLFDAAARFVERLPAAPPRELLDHLLSQDVAGDSLVAGAPDGESVAVVTPASAAGREWDLVAVAGVQEGAWPDLRLRGSLLGSSQLVDVVTGRAGDVRAARAAVRHDETRLFHVAVTRARQRLVVTAVRSEDEQPSPYLDVVDPRVEARAFTDVPRPLSLPGLVAELRREVAAAPDPRDRAAAVTALARLAVAEVPGADPSQWWALRELSDDRPRRAPDHHVEVSPSAVDRFTRCSLQWALRQVGGEGPSIGAADIGTLVHEVAHDLGDTDAEAYAAELERRWGRLGMPPGWLSRRDLARAQQMTGRLATYVREADAAGWRRAASEVAIRVSLGRAVVAGRVDRVEVGPDGRVRIVDLKTGASKPKADEVARHGQLGTYQLAVEAGAVHVHGTRSGGAALLQLGKAAGARTTLQTQPALADDPDPEWAAHLLATTADAMGAATFTATPGDWCGACQLQSSCPAREEGRRL